MEYDTITALKIETMENSDWRVELFGMGEYGIVIHPAKQSPIPNFFWRWMQYICFGNKWIRKRK